MVVCSVTLQELANGVKRKGSQKLEAWFSELLPELSALPLTTEVSLLAGEFQANLQKSGLQLADADAMIAATASTTGRTLVTRNIKDFADCPLTLKNPFI
jgi:toxin FitB